MGVKYYILADAETGYCLKDLPYFGSSTSPKEDETDTNTDTIVKQLLQSSHNFNHTLYIDSYYCHPSLLMELKEKGIYATGTMRSNRKDAPKIITTATLKKSEIKVYKMDEDMFCAKWKDKREITLLTSFDTFKPTKYFNSKGKLIEKPLAVFNYNQNMRGADILNQLCSYYR